MAFDVPVKGEETPPLFTAPVSPAFDDGAITPPDVPASVEVAVKQDNSEFLVSLSRGPAFPPSGVIDLDPWHPESGDPTLVPSGLPAPSSDASAAVTPGTVTRNWLPAPPGPVQRQKRPVVRPTSPLPKKRPRRGLKDTRDALETSLSAVAVRAEGIGRVRAMLICVRTCIRARVLAPCLRHADAIVHPF